MFGDQVSTETSPLSRLLLVPFNYANPNILLVALRSRLERVL